MSNTRRDILALGGGLAAGIVFTPAPWKLLDDASIWTQNWPWIPQPVKGPVDWKEGVCTMCPAGCGLKVKMAGGYVVGLSGKDGALCALGYGAHQMNFHPRRLRAVHHDGQPSTWEAAEAAFRKAGEEGPVALVDGRPARSVSRAYRAWAEGTKGASYFVARPPEEAALVPLAKLAAVPVEELAYDLEQSKLVLSLNAPLLEGWGGPQRVQKLWPELKIVQAESVKSRTGDCAWQRILIRQGAEAALAMAVAHVLLDEKLVAATAPRPPKTAADHAKDAGVELNVVVDLARTLVSNRPAVVIGRDAEPAVAALNILLGAVGAPGGIVRRGPAAGAFQSMDEMPTGLRAAILDSTVPHGKQPGGSAEIFRFSAWRGEDEKGWQLPGPGFLEENPDGVGDALLKPPEGIKTLAAFLGVEAAAIESRPEASEKPLTCRLDTWPQQALPAGQAADWTAAWTPAVLPPLSGKLYQESALFPAPKKGLLA